MNAERWLEVYAARDAAIKVLLHNVNGPVDGLPRTAGWGYPEPYTRDLLLSFFGVVASENEVLLNSIRRVLETLAQNQTRHGHISSLVHDKEDLGSSDSTPLFLLITGLYRKLINDDLFLHEAVERSLRWMEYQSPSDRILVAQQPTSDWRDEQWVLGYGLFVNTLVFGYLKALGQHDKAESMKKEMSRFTITGGVQHQDVHEGLAMENKPYYALWSYKVLSSERFDLLGNSLAILSGIASPSRAEEMVSWIEAECEALRKNDLLAVDLPPNFFPYTKPGDYDWHERYQQFNLPGDYHNGGIWPFICGFYIAALVAAKRYELAEDKLMELTRVIKLSKGRDLDYGFNEWIKAQDGEPKGQDWQTWSAALYIYAVKCVELRSTPFFEEMRLYM
ncbi:amylo-alpha-1,6-glucosidase [Chitinophaga silvatica]|uniref:beta-fructofuranosidase n=1 Tax=Chitinophaga silvatica TaxID=2282649 RepID=A0A3E1YGI8_9BACT|nr:glycoside hydrolase 100 family protein [Chitinophaga silvatica]RFS26535.1 amylo-alpha-1,6-glucosidase [Chitinophaga silvatica]